MYSGIARRKDIHLLLCFMAFVFFPPKSKWSRCALGGQLHDSPLNLAIPGIEAETKVLGSLWRRKVVRKLRESSFP